MKPPEAIGMMRSALGVRGSYHDALRPAADAVSRLADHGGLLEIIRGVRDDPAAGERYADASLRHPLGHDKIMLLDADSEFQLRVHAWWPDDNPRMEHVHHHRFGFASRVLRGQYEMQIFQPAQAGIPMIQYRQHVNLGGTEWFLEAGQTVHLQLLSTTRVIAGACYTLAPDALHRVIVSPAEPCITLFLAITRYANMSAGTQVFAPADSDAPARSDCHPLTADIYRKKLDAILSELTSSD